MKKTILFILSLPLMFLGGCENINTDDCIHAYATIIDESLKIDSCPEFSIQLTDIINDPQGELENQPKSYCFMPSNLSDKYKRDGMRVEVYCRNIHPGYICGFMSFALIDIVKIKEVK